MSDETSQAPEATPVAESAPRVRRISNPRPKKQSAAPKPAPEAPAEEAPAESKMSQDWPEPEAPSEPGESAEAKRKRRRRKGKGGKNKDQSSAPAAEEIHPLVDTAPVAAEAAPQSAPAVVSQAPAPVAKQAPQPQHQPQQQQRNPADPKELATKAWKIFLAEVSEEGVSLISDHDARELSRRCFRLAEIFLDEQGRRIR